MSDSDGSSDSSDEFSYTNAASRFKHLSTKIVTQQLTKQEKSANLDSSKNNIKGYPNIVVADSRSTEQIDQDSNSYSKRKRLKLDGKNKSGAEIPECTEHIEQDSDDDKTLLERLDKRKKSNSGIDSNSDQPQLEHLATTSKNSSFTEILKRTEDIEQIDLDSNSNESLLECLDRNGRLSSGSNSSSCAEISEPVENSELDISLLINSIITRRQATIGRTRSGRRTAAQTRRGQRGQKAVVVVSEPIVLDSIDITSESKLSTDDPDYFKLIVLWMSQKYEKFDMRRSANFEFMFKHFSDLQNVCEERCLFTFQDRIVKKSDTPASLGMTAGSIMEGGIVSEKHFYGANIAYRSENIELKVQIKDRKKPLIVAVTVFEEMSNLMKKVSEEINISVEQLKFRFDGDELLPNSTPMSLELEGGEIIDCDKK